MTIIEKKFGKYAVTLDTEMEDGVTGCWIECGKQSASLACLIDTGELSGGHEVPEETVQQIEQWADANGY